MRLARAERGQHREALKRASTARDGAHHRRRVCAGATVVACESPPAPPRLPIAAPTASGAVADDDDRCEEGLPPFITLASGVKPPL
jgi:hypothetical protein